MNYIENEEYESNNQGASQTEGDTGLNEEKTSKPVKAFAFWEVAGEKLKLKLTTPATLELEKKFRKNLISLIGDEDNIPALTTMLQIIHAAAEPWKHGLKLKHITDYYEKYLEEGGNQLSLYVDVYMQVFMVSGFFSTSMVEDMEDSMGQVQKKM